MADVTIVGGGSAARSCGEILSRAGFSLQHAFELGDGERTPVILGDVHGAFAIARGAVEAGRHLLITNASVLSPDRLSLLLENRKRNQAIYVWSERRFHPGYRFVGGLTEADASWRPRYVRQESLSLEPTNAALARWRTLEALSLVMSLLSDAPLSLNAAAIANARRNAPEQLRLSIDFEHADAVIQVGMGEAVERRETLLAAASRKVYVDELNTSMPVRIVEDEPGLRPNSGARWLSTAAATQDETARQQCLAFLDATMTADHARDEAAIWLRSLAALEAMDRSLNLNGARVEVSEPAAEPRFRLVPTRLATPHIVA